MCAAFDSQISKTNDPGLWHLSALTPSQCVQLLAHSFPCDSYIASMHMLIIMAKTFIRRVHTYKIRKWHPMQ